MAKSVKFELDLAGLNELMKSAEMQGHLSAAGQTVADMAGSGYDAEVITGHYIAAVNIYPNTRQAAIENYRENTLLKSLGSAGLSMNK